MAHRYRGRDDRDYGSSHNPGYWNPNPGERGQNRQLQQHGDNYGYRGNARGGSEPWRDQDVSGMGSDQRSSGYGGTRGREPYFGERNFDDDWSRSQYSTTGRPYGQMESGQQMPRLGPGSSREEWQAGPAYDRGGGQGYGSQGYSDSGYGQSGYGPGGRSGYGGRGSYGSQTGFGQTSMDVSGMTGQYGQQSGYRGRGPKGYQRSAERLKEDICERLTEAPDVDASEITIHCKDGIVTLEGTVESRQMKHRAEDIVEACSGVKDVENRLRVASSQSGLSSQAGQGEQGRRGGGMLSH